MLRLDLVTVHVAVLSLGVPALFVKHIALAELRVRMPGKQRNTSVELLDGRVMVTHVVLAHPKYVVRGGVRFVEMHALVQCRSCLFIPGQLLLVHSLPIKPFRG